MKCPVCNNPVENGTDRTLFGRFPDKIYISEGAHEKLQQAKVLREQISTLLQEVRDEDKEVRKTLKPDYSTEVNVGICKCTTFFDDMEVGQEYLQVIQTLQNEEDFQSHIRRYGSIDSPPQSVQQSVRYYRLHGILFRSGGGYLHLKDKQPCSDSEWEDLKSGKIADKFWNKK